MQMPISALAPSYFQSEGARAEIGICITALEINIDPLKHEIVETYLMQTG